MPSTTLARKKGSQFSYSKIREHTRDMSSILYERIFRELQKGEFDIVVSTHTGSEAGYTDYENNAIVLNPAIFPIEETLVHEVLHILKPEADEETIIELSSLLYEKLDTKKRAHLNTYIKALTIHWIGIRESQWAHYALQQAH